MLKDFIHFLTYGLQSPPETIVVYEKVTEVVTEVLTEEKIVEKEVVKTVIEEKIVEKLIPVEKEVIKTEIKEVEVPYLHYSNVILPGDKVIIRKDIGKLKNAIVYLVIDIANNGYNKDATLFLNNAELILESELVKVDYNTPIVDYDLNYEGLYNLITTKKRYDKERTIANSKKR